MCLKLKQKVAEFILPKYCTYVIHLKRMLEFSSHIKGPVMHPLPKTSLQMPIMFIQDLANNSSIIYPSHAA